jgi:dihydropteroate synthase
MTDSNLQKSADMNGTPQIMGILNVTPDSFSDGGRFLSTEAACRRAREMIVEGATWIDVGGESTRPGAAPVALEEEKRRILPVIEALAAENLAISVDTCKPEVAKAALELGARMVNDVTALRDPEMVAVCKDAGCDVILMHMQGEPRTMQASPTYDDVVGEVLGFLRERAEQVVQSGVGAERIWIDPGIGFGKTVDHNIALLRNIGRFVETGFRTVLGVSRKSFIAHLDPSSTSPTDRLGGTLAAQLWGQWQGVAMMRVHDVREAVQAARIWQVLSTEEKNAAWT